MKTKPASLFLLALAANFALVAGGWWLLEKPPVFREVTSIVFESKSEDGPVLKLEITQPPDVAAFVSTIQLEKKEECKCGRHWLTVVFKGAGKEIKASICNHCFDVETPRQVRRYAMPKDFYEQFKKRLSQEQIAEFHL